VSAERRGNFCRRHFPIQGFDFEAISAAESFLKIIEGRKKRNESKQERLKTHKKGEESEEAQRKYRRIDSQKAKLEMIERIE